MAPFINFLQKAGQAVFTIASSFHKHIPVHSHPDLNVTITPKYFESSQISSFDVRMVIAQPEIERGHGLVFMKLNSGDVPSCRYDGDALSAFDEQGLLDLTYEDNPAPGNENIRTWFPTRDTDGDLVLSFETFPREVNLSTRPGPRFELLQDQGGLIGTGKSFLPLPMNESDTYNINLVWNLETTPAGTRAVWAFGEGNTSRTAPASDLGGAFAVGPVRSYSHPEKDFGVYWFGDTPFNSTGLSIDVEYLLSGMLDYFQEPEPTFRVFIRKAIFKSIGGSGSEKSFLLEYSDELWNFIPIDGQFITSLVVHEIVHEWPLLDSGNDVSRDIRSSVAWYDEGFAIYYQALLPYQYGVFNRSQFLRELNNIASAYYTSPAIEMDDNTAERLEWLDTHAQRIPYYRGAMFLFKLDAELRAVSRGKRSVYEPMIEVLKLKNERKPFGIKQWLPLIEAELGQNSTLDFKAMLAGEIVIPPSDCLAHFGLKLVRRDQERYELGFDESSLSKQVITGLKVGSRAEEAGLKEGDVVEKMFPIFITADNYEMKSVVRVVRGGEVVGIEYWPRSWEKVEAYHWVDLGDDGEL